MIIYSSHTDDFAAKVRENALTDIIADSFRGHFGRSASESEKASWQNSLGWVKNLIELADLHENMIALEYEIPYNQCRIDCLLFGTSSDKEPNVVLIELKQWSRVTPAAEEGNYVETYLGGKERVVPHPSQQVKGYHDYLLNFLSAFDEPPRMTLFSCAYCHNYASSNNEGLFAAPFRKIVADYPVYAKKDTKALAERLKALLKGGSGFEVFNRFMQSPVRPSKKLLDNVKQIIENRPVFSLINEQIVAKNLIWAKVRKAKRNSVVIVRGGPGTGKSVIALNILAEAAKFGKTAYYGCKSKPFIEGLKSLVGRDAEMLFSNLFRFVPNRMQEAEADLLIVDEAHRIERSSNFQYTKKSDRTAMPQVEQLIRCAKTAVFFIDDKQNVRSREIGNSVVIREAAEKYSRDVSEVELLTQFRCMGSNDYLAWVESMLGFGGEPGTLKKDNKFDFQIVDTPKELYRLILGKESQKPNSARLVAGYCWPWSKEVDENGDLIKDVKIGDFAMPWETSDQISTPPKGYVKWYQWAYKPLGIKQVGCIYTAQGFEFEYVGVIIGNDIVYDEEKGRLKTNINASADPTLRLSPATFDMHVRNIYRVLMTRGMKGCFVYFLNEGARKYFQSHIEN